MKGGTRVSTLGQEVGGLCSPRGGQEPGLGSWGRPGHPTPSWTASALLGSSGVLTHTRTWAHLPACLHTRTHSHMWSPNPEQSWGGSS